MSGGDNTKMAQRYAAYSAARDRGLLIADAAGEAGITDSAAVRYERSYRQANPGRRMAVRDTGVLPGTRIGIIEATRIVTRTGVSERAEVERHRDEQAAKAGAS